MSFFLHEAVRRYMFVHRHENDTMSDVSSSNYVPYQEEMPKQIHCSSLSTFLALTNNGVELVISIQVLQEQSGSGKNLGAWNNPLEVG